MRQSFKGFTLSEVLLALAIIGVVAVLTIPGSITNYQKKVTAVKVKKAYVELNQAVQLSQVENGPMKFWDLGDKPSIENTRAVVEKYIVPYYNNLVECSSGIEYDCGMPMSRYGVNYRYNNIGISFYTPSQSSGLLYVTISPTMNKAVGMIAGKDWFYFQIVPDKIVPFGFMEGITRENVIAGYTTQGYTTGVNDELVKVDMEVECSSTARYGCTMLWYLDGFEFKEDYPW